MVHGGKLSTTGGNIFATLVASRQSAPSKWGHLCSAHVAASRKTSVGFKGAAKARISGVAGTRAFRYSTTGRDPSCWTTPRTMARSMPGCALGQSFDMVDPGLGLELDDLGGCRNAEEDVSPDRQDRAGLPRRARGAERFGMGLRNLTRNLRREGLGFGQRHLRQDFIRHRT